MAHKQGHRKKYSQKYGTKHRYTKGKTPRNNKNDTARLHTKRRQRRNKTLKKRKEHGAEGIPAEAYQATQTWITEPLTHMINEIKMGNNYQQTGKTEQ